VADLEPRRAVEAGGLFASGIQLQLRDRSGRLLESLAPSRAEPVWGGSIAVLVNGATAGSAEALTSLLADRGAPVLGEETYGLGAEAKLYELENGAGLVVSSALWETVSGKRWNAAGVSPDEVIHGEGSDFDSLSRDQLQRALEWFERHPEQDSAGEREKIAA
jgi:C-terminal processing protease CtpA/Prc